MDEILHPQLLNCWDAERMASFAENIVNFCHRHAPRHAVAVGTALQSDISKTNLLMYASGMAYITLGSIVPFLGATFSLIAAFVPLTDPDDATWFSVFQNFILRNLAPESGAQTLDYLEKFLANLDVKSIGMTGLAFLLVSAVMLLRNIEIALNDIWQVSDTRSIFKRFIYFWTTITLGALILSIVVGVVSEFKLDNLIPMLGRDGDVASIPFLPQVTTILSTFAFFAILYKIGPNCHVTFKAAISGAVVSTILIRLAAHGYGIYVANNEWNQNVYGALAAVPLFLLWIYVAWVVILFGAIISWRVQFGFAAKREEHNPTAVSTSTPKECERNWQLRALLPAFCTIAVVHRYIQSTGHGVTGTDIALELDLPPAWVREGILVSLDHGFIVEGHHRIRDASENEDNDVLDTELFPAYPAEKISVKQMVGSLAEEAIAWLEKRQGTLPIDLYAASLRVFVTLRDPEQDISLKELLEIAGRKAG